MPLIQYHLPGCGITPFNVWDLTFHWWRIYRELAEKAVTAAKETRRGK